MTCRRIQAFFKARASHTGCLHGHEYRSHGYQDDGQVTEPDGRPPWLSNGGIFQLNVKHGSRLAQLVGMVLGGTRDAKLLNRRKKKL